MSPVTAERRPLPVAPRPFGAEVLGGWIGRLAARYRMTVKEFADRHSLDLGIDDGGGWLAMPALSNQSVGVLAAITRISRAQIMAIHAPSPFKSERVHFCYCARCVLLTRWMSLRRSGGGSGWTKGCRHARCTTKSSRRCQVAVSLHVGT